MTNLIEEIYISVDVEADGKIPQRNSLMAIGATVTGYRTRDGQLVDVSPKSSDDRFYVQLKPISEDWDPKAIAVAVLVGFDKDTVDPTGVLKHTFLKEHGETPEAGMEKFTAWVRERQAFYEAKGSIFVGFPVVYDWMWVYWYMIAFTVEGSPFGHGRAADIKTAYATKSNSSLLGSSKRRMHKFLFSKLPHTHLAVDDAAEQGQLAMNILRWDGKPEQNKSDEISDEELIAFARKVRAEIKADLAKGKEDIAKSVDKAKPFFNKAAEGLLNFIDPKDKK